MQVDDPITVHILKQCMVARIATLSQTGRPSINPLYFIYFEGRIWLGTAAWTLAARNVKGNPQVSVLFQIEQEPGDRRVLCITGQAAVRTDREAQRFYNPRVARKYILTPSGLRNWLTHPRQLWLRRYYAAQSRQKGPPCVIEVMPEQAELLTGESPSTI